MGTAHHDQGGEDATEDVSQRRAGRTSDLLRHPWRSGGPRRAAGIPTGRATTGAEPDDQGPAYSELTTPDPPELLTPRQLGWTGQPVLLDYWDLLADPAARVPFSKIVSAHWLTLSRPELRDEAYAAEKALRRRFETQQGRIQNSYFCRHTPGGSVLVERDLGDRHGTVCKLFTSMRSDSVDLALLMGHCETVLDDAAAVFGGPRSAQVRRIRRIGAATYATSTRILSAVDAWARTTETAPRKSEMAAVKAAFAVTQREVDAMVQRAARFRYFGGVLAGAALALAVCALVGWLNARHWSTVVNTSALTAATVFGVLGAVASVFQRTATGQLIVDYLAPPWQIMAIAALRPFVGAILGLVSQFALITAQLATQQRNPITDASFGIFALVGFAAGFSERFATDMIERAGRILTNTDNTNTEPNSPPTRR